MPWLVTGVDRAASLLLSLRLARRLVADTRAASVDGVPAVPDVVPRAAPRRSPARLRISRPVAIVSSIRVPVPVIARASEAGNRAAGCGALPGSSPAQLEAILAHELAHVRRHDYLVNLAQTVIETLLFYHPAVWWVSRQVRVAREHCCDDIAVTVCRSRARATSAPCSASRSCAAGSARARARRY